MHLRTYYPTVVLSDIHLGTSHSKTIEVSNFLKSVNCDRLILNGDIIDGWHLRKAGTKRWQAKHTDFFKVIMKMMENFGTEVIYVRGNHDDFLDSLVPMTFYNVKIVKEYILETHGKRYYVTENNTVSPTGYDIGYKSGSPIRGMYNLHRPTGLTISSVW